MQTGADCGWTSAPKHASLWVADTPLNMCFLGNARPGKKWVAFKKCPSQDFKRRKTSFLPNQVEKRNFITWSGSPTEAGKLGLREGPLPEGRDGAFQGWSC